MSEKKLPPAINISAINDEKEKTPLKISNKSVISTVPTIPSSRIQIPRQSAPYNNMYGHDDEVVITGGRTINSGR